MFNLGYTTSLPDDSHHSPTTKVAQFPMAVRVGALRNHIPSGHSCNAFVVYIGSAFHDEMCGSDALVARSCSSLMLLKTDACTRICAWVAQVKHRRFA